MPNKPKTADGQQIIEALRKKLPERERRVVPAEAGTVELRAAVDGVGPKIGMTIPYDTDSVEMYGFTERIAPGAFARSIKNGRSSRRSQDVVALWNHDPSWVLGRQANDSLTFTDGEKQLDAVVTLDGDDAMHRHFARRIERRDVQGSSFGFETVKDQWEYHDDGTVTRTLIEVKMFDISPVTYPAYPDSGAEQRSLIDVATIRAGVDLGDLADLLAAAVAGKVPLERRAALAGWVDRLGGFLPPMPAPAIDWGRRLALRERHL